MKNMLKVIKYDLKSGYIYNKIKLIIFEILCVGIGVIGGSSIKSCENNKFNASIGDYICFVVGGPKHINKGEISEYVIPVLWLIISIMIAYAIGYYAAKDLYTYGMQVLIRTNSRKKWWVSKVIWCVITIISMYALLYTTIFIIAKLNGAKMTMELTPKVAIELCNIKTLSGTDYENNIILLFMPVLVTIAISLLQLTISIITTSIIAFIITQSIVLFSTIFEYKFLIANYGMLSHNRITCGSNIVYSEGIIICLIVIAISFMVGDLYFNKCDILLKELD